MFEAKNWMQMSRLASYHNTCCHSRLQMFSRKEPILDERIMGWWKKGPNTLSSGGPLVKISGLILLKCCSYLLVLKGISYLRSAREKKWNCVTRVFLNVTHREANGSSPPTLDKNCSLQSVQKDYTQAALSCDFNLPQKQFVTLSSGALTHPKASTNTTGNTNTHTGTQQASGAIPWPLVPSQRGAVHHYTTAPLMPSCKFCSFSPGFRRVLCCWWKEGGVERTEEWSHCLCEIAKSLCPHEGWDC